VSSEFWDLRNPISIQEKILREIQERWGGALELLAKAHYCPDSDNCSFGNEGCMTDEDFEPLRREHPDL
jgi:hypothetical protein